MNVALTPIMKEALPVLETLRQHGYEAVFVGGAVRDTVLGLPVHDVDIATSALPEQTMALFPHAIATGLQHGTVTVIHDGKPYEVTTYRTESAYEDYRRPSGVSFITELDGDLQRRDFTINAMALDADGSLYDPFGGLDDLRTRRLRCVGDAGLRLQEDALRMLRAVRFAGAYRLIPAASTWRELKRHRRLLSHVALERVQSELDKMIAGAAPARGLAWLAASGLLRCTREPLELPERLPMRGAERLGELRETEARWACLFMLLGMDSAAAGRTLGTLRLAKARIAAIQAALDVHEAIGAAASRESAEAAWQRCVLDYGEAAALRWLEAARILPPSALRPQREWLDRFETLLRDMPAKTLAELAVNGKELERALGRKAGPWLRDMLRRLLLAVALRELDNDTDRLLEQAKVWNDEGLHNEP